MGMISTMFSIISHLLIGLAALNAEAMSIAPQATVTRIFLLMSGWNDYLSNFT
jgi:hypothetical protein